ncbi:MAG: FprA family A-type flavoprotein [Candidatus Heimdallarchaeaceae archaeon]
MKEISPEIFYVGVNDYKTDLFESMWPLPEGVSYNAYVVKGTEKVAVIDTVKIPFVKEYLEKIEEVTSFDKIDYIILNHMEPDHTGSLLKLLEKAPQAEIYCSKKAVSMVKNLFNLEKNVHGVEEAEELDLGGKKLIFYMDPLVHWPETMVTYEAETKVLFSSDAFGSFKGLKEGITDEEVDYQSYIDETIRYFSNIVSKYTKYVKKALDKLLPLEIKVIAPAHGLIWKKDINHIVSLYQRLADLEGEKNILVLWGSMYGNTKMVVDSVVEGIEEEGLKALVLDVARDHLSYQIKETAKNQGIILGFPTYDSEEFPPISFYLDMMRRKNIRNRVVGFFGSSLWSGRALKRAADKLKALDWQIIDPLLEFRGKPTEELLTQAKELGKQVAQTVKEL